MGTCFCTGICKRPPYRCPADWIDYKEKKVLDVTQDYKEKKVLDVTDEEIVLIEEFLRYIRRKSGQYKA